MMLAGRQLLLEELSADLQNKLDHLKRNRDVVCVQGVIKKSSKYMCQRCGNIEQRLFVSLLCKRCNEVCTYCRKCITMGRVSECTVLVRGIAEISGESYLNPLQWEGVLSDGQELAAQSVVDAVKQKESFLFGRCAGLEKQKCCFAELQRHYKREKEFVLQRRERTLYLN